MESQNAVTPDEILTGKRKEQKNEDSALFPYISTDYFSDEELDEIFKPQPRNAIDETIKAYNESPIKPFIRRRNQNEGDEYAPEHNTWEIGIKFEF